MSLAPRMSCWRRFAESCWPDLCSSRWCAAGGRALAPCARPRATWALSSTPGLQPTGHDTAVPATAQPIDDEAVAGGDPASQAGGQVPGRSAATA